MTASSTRPFAREVGCQKKQDIHDVGPTTSGLVAISSRQWGRWGSFNQASLQDGGFMGFGSEMKNKNNKIEINRHQPRGVQTSLGWRMMKETSGNFLYHFPLT